MTLGKMKTLRFWAPAALTILYWVALVSIIADVRCDIMVIFDQRYAAAFIIPAAIYYITPMRSWVNGRTHSKINENLRSGMVKIAGFEDDPTKYSWTNLRSLFYKLVDDDKTLSTKASLAYFNGLIWTSFADSAVISFFYALVSVLLYYLDVPHALYAVVLFAIISAISLIGNNIAADRQIKIGNEQLEVMKFEHKAAIEKRLNQLDC